jgi:hypothetical protein
LAEQQADNGQETKKPSALFAERAGHEEADALNNSSQKATGQGKPPGERASRWAERNGTPDSIQPNLTGQGNLAGQGQGGQTDGRRPAITPPWSAPTGQNPAWAGRVEIPRT